MGYDGITQLKIFAALISTALALALDALPLVVTCAPGVTAAAYAVVHLFSHGSDSLSCKLPHGLLEGQSPQFWVPLQVPGSRVISTVFMNSEDTEDVKFKAAMHGNVV